MPYKLLLVDDDAADRAVVRRALRKSSLDIELVEAVDGRAGLATLRTESVDCVLLDYRLPDLDGLSFVNTLAEQQDIALLPILMLTGAGSEAVAVEAMKHGVVDYLIKDALTPARLERATRQALTIAGHRRERRHAEIALAESEARYRDLFENAHDLIQSATPEGKLLYVNRAWREVLQYTDDEVRRLSIADVVHPDNRLHCQGQFERVLAGEQLDHVEVEFVTKNGQTIILEGSVNCRYENGQPIATRGIFRDITARKQMELVLFKEKERLQTTLHSIADGVITTDAEGCVEFLNPIAETLTGWVLGDARGQPIDRVFRIAQEDTNEPLPNPVTQCIREKQVVGLPDRTVLISRNNDRTAIQDSAAPIRAPDGSLLGAVLVFQDVTEARGLARQVEYQARHDALTGLLNRREFERRLQRALSSTQQDDKQHALCYLDLDNFKIVNDTAGHVAGDALLKQIAHLLGSRLRARDSLARIGGDEFSVLLESCPLEKAHEVAEEMVAIIRRLRFTWDDQVYEIGVSIGMVPVTAEVESVAQLLTQADVACYAAKDQGRNRVVAYHADDGDSARRHREMLRAAGLRNALDNDRFCLYGQEIVALTPAPESLIHYEMLLRLRDENDQVLLPGAFIPAAERYHIMGAIDRWVIEAALHQYQQLFSARNNAGITINLSGNSFTDDTLLHFVREQLAASAVPPERVCFEITETAAIRNLAQATKFVTALKESGCRFALDDFGSGLSSFNYLKQFPVDYLKIDGSFVRGMVDDPLDRAMVESINTIGHVMGIQTIAEWVENEAILDQLKAIGVDYAQGYAVGYPAPIEELAIGESDGQRSSGSKLKAIDGAA